MAGQERWSVTTAVSTPTCSNKPAGATGHTFDSLGQRTATTSAAGTPSSYGYDQAGRLTATPSGTGIHTYNGLGQRISKKVGTVTTNLVWDTSTMPSMLSDGITNYLYGPGRQPDRTNRRREKPVSVHDQIGSTRTLLSITGTSALGYDYTPYGTAADTGATGTPHQFSGRYTDTETGLIYLRAGYYDPSPSSSRLILSSAKPYPVYVCRR